MTALFILAKEHRALADKLHDLDLDDQTIADTLEGESGDLVEKGKTSPPCFAISNRTPSRSRKPSSN